MPRSRSPTNPAHNLGTKRFNCVRRKILFARWAVKAVEIFRIDWLAAETQLKHLQVAAAVKHLVREITLHHKPESSKCDAGDYREHADDTGANDRSGDHCGDRRLFELERRLVPSDLRARFDLLQQGIGLCLRTRSVNYCEQRHGALGE